MRRFESFMITKVSIQRDNSRRLQSPKYFALAMSQIFASILIDKTMWVGKDAMFRKTLTFLSFQIA